MRKDKNNLLDLSLKAYQIERASSLKFSTKRNQKFYGASFLNMYFEKNQKKVSICLLSHHKPHEISKKRFYVACFPIIYPEKKFKTFLICLLSNHILINCKTNFYMTF